MQRSVSLVDLARRSMYNFFASFVFNGNGRSDLTSAVSEVSKRGVNMSAAMTVGVTF